MSRFYSNENFPVQVVEGLRVLGHDVVTIQERGFANEAATDPQVLQHAIDENRAVLTLNRKDFIRLHKGNPQHSGIVVCTVDNDFSGQAQRIHEHVENIPDLSGQLIRVNRPNA